MDPTLTQILRELVQAHAWRDWAEPELEQLRIRVQRLDAVEALLSGELPPGWRLVKEST